MANELRIFQDLLGGRIDNNPLLIGGTSLSSPALAAMQAVSANQHMMVVLDPDGLAGAPEIVMVTAHTSSATTATIARAQLGSLAREHAVGTDWVHAPLSSDVVPQGAWISYTPAWTSTGTAPVLGNGTAVGAYTQIGKTVHFRSDITFGSTTTFGTGTYLFSLPVASKTLTTNHGLLISGYMEDYLVTAYAFAAARLITTTTYDLLYATTGAATQQVGQTGPFTWGSNDYIRVFGTYEAA